MKDKIKSFFDITFWKFILVGLANTAFGAAIMFLFYNVLHLDYWISSASNYIFGSILSYFLNKNFTFQNKSKNWTVLYRFVINILLYYLIAYGAARPVVRFALAGASEHMQDNLSMLLGMGVFVGLNYICLLYTSRCV